MKKTILTFLFVSLITGLEVYSQGKQLTLEEAVIGRWRGLSPENIQELSWIAEKNEYSFLENNTLMQGAPRTEKTEKILNLQDLSKIIKKKDQELRRFPRFSWTESALMSFRHGNQWFLVDPFEKKLVKSTTFDDAAKNIDFCRTNDHLAYTIKNNLYIKPFAGDVIQVTSDTNPDIVNGQEVHRREFGIHSGTFWSPKGKKLAFYRKDERMVSSYPLVNVNTRIATAEPVKYPMAGMKSHHVKVGVYNLKSQDTLFLKTGRPLNQYLTNVSWGPEGRFVYIALLNRDQNHMKLNRYNASTGELDKTLFEEKHEKYVEPQTPVRFVPGQDERFIWMSRRDGYNHIYLYNTEGELIKQLTRGPWEVTGVEGFDKKGQQLYFTSTKESPLERHLYRVNIASGKTTRLTSQPGYHSPHMSADGQYIIDRYSSTETPNTIRMINHKGKTIRTLLKSADPLKDYNLGEVTISTIKAADGETDLYYRMIKPANFDPNKKYPAIVYVYGGPHAQLIHNRWLGGARLWQYYMAQQGYVMLTVDNRGSANRGLAFENVIHKKLGKHEVADQMQGIKMLKNLNYIDNERIGVHGWSYGGFMTTSLMLKKPDQFKVGVAGGPVIDWKYYEVMYGERYMDTPQDNPEGYQQANLKNYVSNLEGKLLLIHGYIDDVVVMQHSLSFIRKAVREGVQLDYFIYPRHQHNVGGKDRLHLMRKITNYFEDYL